LEKLVLKQQPTKEHAQHGCNRTMQFPPPIIVRFDVLARWSFSEKGKLIDDLKPRYLKKQSKNKIKLDCCK
jgi:hypothetical protein